MAKGNIQMTIIQIDNYGPWTLCLGPRREHDLQVLQSELYADLQRLFFSKGGLVFCARFDNMLAITNGIDIDTHREIQESICRRYPITISMGIGAGATAREAQEKATRALQSYGSSQSEERYKILAVSEESLKGDENLVQIAHIDVEKATLMLTDRVSAYEALFTLLRVHGVLAEKFLEKKALVFFIGGDNFMVISNGLTRQDYVKILRRVSGRESLRFKAGIGIACNAIEALKLANESLGKVRRAELKESICILSEQEEDR